MPVAVREIITGSSAQTLASSSLTPAANSLWVIVGTASEPTDTYVYGWGVSGGAEGYTPWDGSGGTDDLELADSFATGFGDDTWGQFVWVQQFGASPSARVVTLDPDAGGTDVLSGIGLTIIEITGHDQADPFIQTAVGHTQDPPLSGPENHTTTFGASPSAEQFYVAIAECNPAATFAAEPSGWAEVDVDQGTIPYAIQVAESTTNTATAVRVDTATGATYHLAVTLFEIRAAPTQVTGTGSLTYGAATAGSGRRTRQGAAALAYGGTISAVGTIPTNQVTGTAALDYGGTLTALGRPARLGTAALAYGGAITGSGQPTKAGTASLDYGGTIAASGQRTITGSGAASYGGAITAVGTIPTDDVLGTASLTYGGTLAATGRRARTGTAVATYGGSLAATGRRVRQGQAVADYGGTLTATGVIPTGAVLGTASLAYGGTLTGSGRVTRSGAAALVYGGTVAGAARVVKLGTAVAAYGGTITAVGTIPTQAVTGTAALAYGGAATAAGTPIRLGTAPLDYGGTLTADGQVSGIVSGALVYGGAITADGTRHRLGTAALAYGYTVGASSGLELAVAMASRTDPAAVLVPATEPSLHMVSSP